DHELANRRGLDALDGPTREYRVDHTGFHGESATLEHEARSFYEGSAARYLVVDDQGDFPFDITDQIPRARDFIVSGAPLVPDRDGQIQAGRVVTDVFGLAHVASNEHVLREVATLSEVITEDWGGLELVSRDAKEALYLRRVQVHGEDAVGPGCLHEVRHE